MVTRRGFLGRLAAAVGALVVGLRAREGYAANEIPEGGWEGQPIWSRGVEDDMRELERATIEDQHGRLHKVEFKRSRFVPSNTVYYLDREGRVIVLRPHAEPEYIDVSPLEHAAREFAAKVGR